MMSLISLCSPAARLQAAGDRQLEPQREDLAIGQGGMLVARRIDRNLERETVPDVLAKQQYYNRNSASPTRFRSSHPSHETHSTSMSSDNLTSRASSTSASLRRESTLDLASPWQNAVGGDPGSL